MARLGPASGPAPRPLRSGVAAGTPSCAVGLVRKEATARMLKGEKPADLPVTLPPGRARLPTLLGVVLATDAPRVHHPPGGERDRARAAPVAHQAHARPGTAWLA